MHLGRFRRCLGTPATGSAFGRAEQQSERSALFNEGEHLAFQAARGIGTGIWTYPPAFAWAFLPAAHLTIAAGYAINFVFMFILVALCGWIVAGIFGFQHWFGVIAALAWQPAIYSGDVGQISAVWLFLIALAMAGAVQGSSLIVGLAVGLMLLKPTIALPFVALLLVRKQWRACAIVALCAGAWYLASVAATAGEWAWIPHYFAVMRTLHDVDMGAVYNGITLPMVLMRLGAAQGSCSRARRDRVHLLPTRVIASERAPSDELHVPSFARA